MGIITISLLLINSIIFSAAQQCISNPCEEKVNIWLSTKRNDKGERVTEGGLDTTQHPTSSEWRLEVDKKQSNCEADGFCRLVATLSAKCNGTQSKILHTQKRYKLYNEDLTWDESKTKCESEKGNLAVPRNGDDIAKFKELAKSSVHGFIYIGFSDLRVQGVYEDIFGNEVKPYWHPHQPSDLDERCGSIFKDSGLMNDLNCNSRISFICEFDS